MRRAGRRLALVLGLALAAVLAACGEAQTVREDPVVVEDVTARTAEGTQRLPAPDAPVRIAVVTHGEAASPFWAVVRNGVEAAAREQRVTVEYRAPEAYSVERMEQLLRAAIAKRPDGLVVSLPEPSIEPVVRRAVRSGIPVVTINSGSDAWRDLGGLVHVGQPERRAGRMAGRRLAAAGVRRALCVNLQVGNRGLGDRCRGFADALREVGGTALTYGVDDADPGGAARLARAIAGGRIDGVLAVDGTGGLLALDALRLSGREDEVTGAAFDLPPDVLRAVQRGDLEFTVDQQPYLQGYWPVSILAQRARYGLVLGEEKLITTGPYFIGPDEATAALELARRSIR